jgi:hypothetical protein
VGQWQVEWSDKFTEWYWWHRETQQVTW